MMLAGEARIIVPTSAVPTYTTEICADAIATTAAIAALEVEAQRALSNANFGDSDALGAIESFAARLALWRARRRDGAENEEFVNKLQQRANTADFYRQVLKLVMAHSTLIADVIIDVGTPTPCTRADHLNRLTSVLQKALAQPLIANASEALRHEWPGHLGSLTDAVGEVTQLSAQNPRRQHVARAVHFDVFARLNRCWTALASAAAHVVGLLDMQPRVVHLGLGGLCKESLLGLWKDAIESIAQGRTVEPPELHLDPVPAPLLKDADALARCLLSTTGIFCGVAESSAPKRARGTKCTPSTPIIADAVLASLAADLLGEEDAQELGQPATPWGCRRQPEHQQLREASCGQLSTRAAATALSALWNLQSENL